MRRVLIVVSLTALIMVLAATVLAGVWLHRPLSTIKAPAVFEVPAGAALVTVASRMHDRGLLQWPDVFALYGRFTGNAGRIQAGEYLLEPAITPAQLLQKLVSGEVRLHAVRLVEGWNYRDVGTELSSNPVLMPVLDYSSAEALAESLQLEQSHAEGLFFPDTYYVPRGTTDAAVLQQAAALMQQHLQAAWASRSSDLPLSTPYELLILASIIERETGLPAERPEIAGVFTRRLKRSMRLQTDPTVIYGIGDDFDGNITRRHLTTDTPYNTYTRAGLPPTPIALPGKGSLHAAANPADGDTLFFVASGLGDGSHVFSVTLEQHNAAVARYLERLRGRQAAPVGPSEDH